MLFFFTPSHVSNPSLVRVNRSFSSLIDLLNRSRLRGPLRIGPNCGQGTEGAISYSTGNKTYENKHERDTLRAEKAGVTPLVWLAYRRMRRAGGGGGGGGEGSDHILLLYMTAFTYIEFISFTN